MTDPTDWGTIDPSYSLDNIYSRSTDGRGQSSEVRARIPPTVAGQIQSLIERREVAGYRTMADFVRDAIVHRLRYVSEEMVAGTAMANRIRAEVRSADLHRLNDEIAQANDDVTNVKDHLKAIRDHGNRRQLEVAIAYAEDVAEGMEEPWRSRIEELVQEARREL